MRKRTLNLLKLLRLQYKKRANLQTMRNISRYKYRPKKYTFNPIISTTPLLFDNFVRTDLSPLRHRELIFDFYNRSAHQNNISARLLLEKAYSNIPSPHVNEITTCLKSNNNKTFKATEFELLINQTLVSLNLNVEIHPNIPNSSKRPDFKLTTASGEELYIEARNMEEKNIDRSGRCLDSGTKKRREHFFSFLNENPHSKYVVDCIDNGPYEAPKLQPKSTLAVQEIHRWLDSISSDKSPSQTYKLVLDDWTLVLKAYLYSNMKPTTLITSNSDSTHPELIKSFRAAYGKKCTRYGNPDIPLILAINHHSPFIRREHFEDALFGTEHGIEFNMTMNSRKTVRLTDGLWISLNCFKNTRIFAVWVFNNLRANNVDGKKNIIYINPGYTGSRILPKELQRITNCSMINSSITYNEGLEPEDILNIGQ